MRQQLTSPDLAIFEDKIKLRRDLLQALGVEHTPTYYMSNSDLNILPHIEGRPSYVVKPTHMTESEYVFVVHNGKNVVDVRANEQVVRLAGEKANASLIQERISEAWGKTAYPWECKAIVDATPGVIVERPVFATLDPGAPDFERVEEARCHVVWGDVAAIEWVVDRQGSTVVGMQEDRVGRRSMNTDIFWAVTLGKSFFRDPDGWSTRVGYMCMRKVIQQARRVADGARVDHLRVDFLVEGDCDRVYVSEVELFPAVPFSERVMRMIERKWIYGYGVDNTVTA